MYFYILLEKIFKHNYFFSRKSIYISSCLQDILTVLVYEKDFCKITKAKRIRNCSAKFFEVKEVTLHLTVMILTSLISRHRL